MNYPKAKYCRQLHRSLRDDIENRGSSIQHPVSSIEHRAPRIAQMDSRLRGNDKINVGAGLCARPPNNKMTKYTTYTIIFLFLFSSLALADQGTGDTFGYTWTDSGTPLPTISYSWVDLGGETSVFGDVFNDSLTGAISLPFTFTYYGTSRNQVYISSNGWFSFVNPGVGVTHPVNAAIPSATGPDALVAPFWDDLASTTGNNGGVYYRTDGTSPNRKFIIEWDLINGTDAIKFEAILDERTNLIKFQYNTIAAAYTGGGSATIGIKSTSSLGNQYSFNSAGSVSAASAILFHNESISDYSASLAPGSVSISDFVSFTYTINNIDPGGAQGLGKIDRMAIGNPFSTTPTITSVTIDGQSALIQLNTSKPTDPNIATWFYKTSGPSDSLIVQTSLFSVGQTVVITYLQGIPSVPEGDYTFASTVDAALYPTSAMAASPQPEVAVSGGSVDYILIRDASNGGGSVFGAHTMTTDQSLTLYAAGYDAGDNFVGDQDVTWTLTGTLDGGGGNGTNFIFNPSVAPTTGTIQAELVSISATDGTGTITVGVGALNSLQIRTEANEGGSPVTNFNMTTDNTQRFWAAGYDTEGNFRGNESVSWTSTLGISGTATSINYSPSAPISGTLTATSGLVNDVANISVTTGALDYLVIRDTPGGVGAVVAARIMNTDETLTLYAAGYDAENNYKQDYVATWTLTGTLDQPGVTNSTFVFSPSTAPTSGSIIATVGNISDVTGTITVDPGALDALEIRTQPNNAGSLVTTFPMTTDDSQTFWAAGFDSEGNFIGDESVTWTSSIGIGGTGTSILFSPDAPISGTLTATSGIISYTTGTINVTVGTLNSLLIRSAAGGAGVIVTDITMTTDNNQILYSAGYDADGNFRQDENATWTLTGSLDQPGSSGTSFNFNPSTAPTTGSILATVGGKSDATGTITVNPGALSYLLIRTAANNGGSQVGTLSMTTVDTRTFWSAGYDAEDNYRGDVAGTVWTSSGTLGIGGSGASILFAPTTPVSGALTATAAGATPYTTGLISVIVASVDHIIVRDAPDGGGSEVTTHTMTTDETLTLYAAGYDAQNNFVENSVVNWSSTGTLDAISGSGTSIVFNPITGPSLGTIVATAGPLSDATGNITVNFGALSSVLIRTAANNGGSQVGTLSMTTVDTRTFWSAGYDAEDNYRGDVASTVWTSSGTLGIGGSGASILFAPTTPVSGALTATAAGATPYTTGLISVIVSSVVDHIIVRDAPNGGGSEVTTRNLTTDQTLTLYAAGYDAQNNFVENTQVNWTLTGTLVGIPISDTVFVFSPAVAPTFGTINAQIGTKQDATGNITVNPGALASVLIRDAGNGGGNVVTTLTMSAGDSRTFWAAGYDGENNYRGNETTAVWTSTFGLGGTGSPFIFNPTVPAVGTVTATVSGIPYTTGTITVTGGILDHLVIRDGPGGTGNDLRGSNFSISADGSITLYAAGYDAENNYVGDQLVDWFSTGSLDFIDVNASIFTFNPVKAPAVGTIGITNGNLASATGDITVTVGVLSDITINSTAGSSGVEVNTLTMSAGESLPFWAAGYDSDGNYISQISADWSSTGSLDVVSSTGTSIVFNPIIAPSLGTIVATAGLFSDATGLITVEEGLLDHLEIRTAPDGGGVIVGITNLTADQSLTMYAAAYDANDNYLYDISVSWSSTPTLDIINATGSSYTFNPVFAPSNGTIVATSGEYTRQTGTITVSLGAFDHITINSSSGPGGVPVEDIIMTADDTRTFHTASYDADNNFLGMVGATWNKTGTLDVVSGTGPSYTFNPVTAPTSGTITATFGGQNDATGTITVNTGALAYVLITDAAGVEIGNVSTNVGADLILQSRGYDQDNNYRGREIAIWRSTGSLDDVSSIGETYVFTPQSAPTTGTIIATSETDPTKSDTTGTITVAEGVLSRIQIRTQPDGGGVEFGSYNMTADGSVTLYAAGYDGADNFKGNTAVNWSSIGSLESISGTGTSFHFSPTVAPASGLIRITSGPMTDETGTITVSPGAVVGISDANGLSGQRTTVAGLPQLIRVFARDQHGNPVSGVTVNFSPPGMMSVASDVTDLDGIAESVYNTPRTEDSSIVQASVPGLSPVNFTIYAIRYISGSLNPKVVQVGGTTSFTVRVSNPGNTLVPLNTSSSNFSFSSGSYNYSASLVSPGSLLPNSSNITLTFAATGIDPNFPGGSHTADINLVGSGSFSFMNGILQTDIGELTIGTDAITIGNIQLFDSDENPINEVLQGQQGIIAKLIVTNIGPVMGIDPYPSTRLEFNDGPSSVLNLQRTDGLLFLQSGGVPNELEFQFDLPPSYPTGQITVNAILSMNNENLEVVDPAGFMTVLQAGNANYVPGSLTPDEVIPRQVVYFGASFENTGSAGIVLSPNESSIQILGSGTGASNLVSQFTLLGNSTTEIFFEPITIPIGLPTGNYTVRWTLGGNIGSSDFDTTAQIINGLSVLAPANLLISNVNIIPDRVKQGQTGIEIRYAIKNQGQSAGALTNIDHNFNFVSGGEVTANQWIPIELDPELPSQIAPGATVTFTTIYALAPSATTGMVYPNPIVTYHDIKAPAFSDESNTIGTNDQVEVVAPASVKIVQLQGLAPNAPFVNEEQQFSLDLTLENTGADQIQTAWVSLFRNAEQEPFTDQLMLTNIAPDGQKSISIMHSENISGTYLYKAFIDSAKDVVGDPVLIIQPDDRDELMNVQEPSRLEIDASILSKSMTYDSLTVSEDQEFFVQAKITNFGESAFEEDGNGQFVLHLPSSSFSFLSGPSDSLRSFTSEDTVAEWAILASGVSPGGNYEELTFSLIDIPVDKNTGEDVGDISVSDSAVHIISEEKGRIEVNSSIISPDGAIDGILSTKQEFTVQAVMEFNAAIAVEGRTAEIILPFGYSLKDGQQFIIDSLETSEVEWTIIALDRDRTGDSIYVIAGGYDQNSGLPVTRNSNAIQVSVVERTDLSMTLEILKTSGSPGDTLSVGQQFTLKAVINNDGNAQAVGGGKIYLEGVGENPAIVYFPAEQEDTLSYTIGETVEWGLQIVDLPDGNSGLQSEVFQLMDELEKEKASVKAKSINKITNSNRVRELYLELSDMIAALVTLEMNLTVKMSQIPEDENTDQDAFTRDSVVTITTHVEPVAEIIMLTPVVPQKVSTYQQFNVIVSATYKNSIKDPMAHLLIPESFRNANGNLDWMDLPLESGSNTAEFTINVPSTDNFFGAKAESLSVYLSGKDKNTGEEVLPTAPLWKTMTVEMKPEIFMGREIISPIAAQESGLLSHGQSFIIDVWPELVPSEKDLDYGEIDADGRIKLNDEIFTKYKFERVDDELYDQTFMQLGQKLRFTVRAPREDQTALFDFRFVNLPRDKNSQDPVIVNSDSGSVSLAISVAEKKVTVILENNPDKTTFTRGDGEHLMMAVDISNAGFLDPLNVSGIGLKFIARSDTASLLDNAVANILDEILIMDYEEYVSGSEKKSNITSYADYVVTETNARNPLQVNFDEIGVLSENESVKLAVVAKFKNGESSRSFRIILNNVDAYDDAPEHLVSIIDGEGRSIETSPDMMTQVLSIISTDQEKTFGNFPNPFGRSPNETTEIRFVLNSTSDVTLRIFSLAGELVKSAWNSNLTNLPGGEIYYLIWDGKNDEGDTVLNGVYICVIEIRSDEGTKTYTTKIAYIK